MRSTHGPRLRSNKLLDPLRFPLIAIIAFNLLLRACLPRSLFHDTSSRLLLADALPAPRNHQGNSRYTVDIITPNTTVTEDQEDDDHHRRSLLQMDDHENPSTWQSPVVDFESRYGGGRILSHPIQLYLIWYGQWDEYAQAVIRTAITSLTPTFDPDYSPSLANWWKIATQYTQWPPWGEPVSSNVTINGEYSNDYSHGRTLNLAPGLFVLEDIVASSINRGADVNRSAAVAPFSYDEHGVYMLLLGSDVGVTTASAQRFPFCSFHSFLCLDEAPMSRKGDCTFASDNKVVYTFTPLFSVTNFFDNCILYDPTQALWPPPNGGNGALDSAVSALLHELVDAATDPYGNAWVYNQADNSEVADMCSYVFGPGGYYYCGMEDPYGSFYSSPGVCNSNGKPLHDSKTNAVYNIFGANGTQFLVEYLWSLQSAGCQLQFEEACEKDVVEEQRQSGEGVISVGYFASGNGGPTVGMQRYAPGLNCSWAITVPDAKTLSFTFSVACRPVFSRPHRCLSNGFNTATSDFLQLYSTPDYHLQTAVAGSLVVPTAQIFLGPTAFVKFSTDAFESPPPSCIGWQLTYVPGYCVGALELVNESGNFTDGTPGGQDYASNLNCTWIIKPKTSGGDSLALVFVRMDIGPNDWVAIYDGEQVASTAELRRISGTKFATPFLDPWYTVTTKSGSLLVNFVTHSSEGQGWAAIYGPTHSILAHSPFPSLPLGQPQVVSSSMPSSFSFVSSFSCLLTILVNSFLARLIV